MITLAIRLVSNFEDIMEFVQESQNAELYFQPYLKVITQKTKQEKY